MTNQIPESPVIDLSYDSPNDRSAQASSSRLARSRPTRYDYPIFLSVPSPSTLLPLFQEADHAARSGSGKGNGLRTALILRHALQYSVQHGDIELIAWLAALDGKWEMVLRSEIAEMEDDDGWGLVGMAIQCSCGRQDKEEVVRIIVARWGLEIGPRAGRDLNGWTPLHLAALLSTPPLVSFLLTRGASPHAVTDRGLTPGDLVSGMQNREEMAALLTQATESSETYPNVAFQPSIASTSKRQNMLKRRRNHASRQMETAEKKEKKERQVREREQWIRDHAMIVDVDPDLLLAPNLRESFEQSNGWHIEQAEEDLDGDEEGGEDDHSEVGSNRVDSSMLVFTRSQMPAILDIIVSTYRPVCQPVSKRSLPANALFLYARFAYHLCDETWLEDLVESAVEKIEEGVYANVENLAYLSFWAYNTTLLLHLMRSDQALCIASESLGLLSMVEELINAIHVFVIRVAERRIDAILDTALLDYETLEDFDDVRFEGEWTLFRSFAGKKKRETVLPAGSVASTNGASPARQSLELGTSPSASASALFYSLRENVSSGSPFKSLSKPQSMQNLQSVHPGRKESSDSDSLHPSVEKAILNTISPRSVTDILSSVLLVLQLYEVNPAIVVQAFSQVFFWIACELFNRILTRKKYLCRTKAVQIRMNITVLEDWVRMNALPAKIVTKHLEPVAQILQWLQCSSQITDFDRLIGTLQNMKAINPLQMRRAVRDYRFEVNEGRMSDECIQYLAQLQKDWERRRLQIGLEAMQVEATRRGPGSVISAADHESSDQSTPIDILFESSLSDFVPQSAPECLGELLDSRFMLSFLLPQNDEYLVATPPKDAAFVTAFPSSPFLSDGSKTSRPPSRASFSSSRPMAWTLPKENKLRELPMDFFSWLKEKEAERRQGRVTPQPRRTPNVPNDEPSGPSERHDLVVNTAMLAPKRTDTLPAVEEDEDQTPLAPLQPPINIARRSEKATPPQGVANSSSTPAVQRPLRVSTSLEVLRESHPRSPMSPNSIPYKSLSDYNTSANAHNRQDSYELRIRNAVNSLYSPPASSSSLPERQNSAQHYELARHRRGPQDANAGRRPGGIGSNGDGPDAPLSPGVGSVKSASSDGQASLKESKKKWWKVGKKQSSNNLREDSRNIDRAAREGSEDTIVAKTQARGLASPIQVGGKRSSRIFGN